MDGFCPINVPKSTKTERNKQIRRQGSAVFPHIFLRLHSKQPFRLYMCMYISGLNLKRVPGALFSVSLIKLNRALSII